MSCPFTATGALTFPPDDGEAAVDRPFSVSGSFTSKVEMVCNLVGIGSEAVDFGTIATTGAKAVMVKVDIGATDPVLVLFNGSTDSMQVSAGGMLLTVNPVPTSAGILSMVLAHTASAVVRVVLLGG